jgi:hypothetical protein
VVNKDIYLYWTNRSHLSSRFYFPPSNQVTVTRLIRVAYGDYRLDTIPPGLAIPVPWKPVEKQKAQGSLKPKKPNPQRKKTTSAGPVRWVKGFQ